MSATQAFFTGGHVADMVLAIMALEFLGLSWRALSVGQPRRIGAVILALGPGACLTLALRAALTGDAWPWVAVWITAALPFHIADLIRRDPNFLENPLSLRGRGQGEGAAPRRTPHKHGDVSLLSAFHASPRPHHPALSPTKNGGEGSGVEGL